MGVVHWQRTFEDLLDPLNFLQHVTRAHSHTRDPVLPYGVKLESLGPGDFPSRDSFL